MDLTHFFKLLFDEGHFTTFGGMKDTTPTWIFRDEKLNPRALSSELFCLNPLYPYHDQNPTQTWHSPDRGRRADCNVVSYQTILVEMDTRPIAEQYQIIINSGLPFTSIVFSGGKSLHCLIRLVTPLPDLDSYKRLCLRVFSALGGKSVVDVQNTSPSKMSRIPGFIRDTGKEQQLIELRMRVNNQILIDWIESKIGPEPDLPERVYPRYSFPGVPGSFSSLRPTTRNFLMGITPAPEGERNRTVFIAACDLARCGFTEEVSADKIKEVSDLSEGEIESTVRSAFGKVLSER